MATESEYRQYAQECIRWAKRASSPGDQKAFLDMAAAWMQAAVLARVNERPVFDAPLTSPRLHSVSTEPLRPQSQSLQPDP
jgi:hypothetical protein